MTAKDLVKANYPTIRDMFESHETQTQIKRVLPGFMKVDQLIRVSLTVIRTNPKLLQCSQQSLLACIFGCAQLGLSPEPFLGQAYLVPFWNTRLNCFEATLIPGYRGMITLARRSGEMSSLSAQVVYVNDHFVLKYGLHEMLDHVPAEGDRGEAKGAWCVIKYKDASHSFDYMTIGDLDRIKNLSKSKDKKGNIVGPWIDHEDEMRKKTVIKRTLKLSPLSVEDNKLTQAGYIEDLALSGQNQKDFFLAGPDPIEITGGPVEETKVEAWNDR